MKSTSLILAWGVSALSVIACSNAPAIEGDDTVTRPEPDSGPGATVEDDGGMPGPGPGIVTDEDPVIGECDAGNCEPDPDPPVFGDAGPGCGDGRIDDGETCDDGNPNAGDGCNGICAIEPFHECPEEGEPCVSTIVCGDGRLDPGEFCDDGNTDADDGCDDQCDQDPAYVCAKAGEACKKLSVCGDSRVSKGEACDDGNATADDGCDANCKVETGFKCPIPGGDCVVVTFCGDGTRQSGEQCDDGNTEVADGCGADCRIETDWECDLAGKNCVYTVDCGDGVVNGAEQCDDKNQIDGDGCSADCTMVEKLWTCARPGFPCRPVCGDATRVALEEQCDDGNLVSGDGCSANCRREVGSTCTDPGNDLADVCIAAVCGNGTREAEEGCDDGNAIAGDGCGPTCQNEPTFDATGTAVLACGDGLITGTEKCDDGNQVGGDGCSATCQVEEGYECNDLLELPEQLELAITYRDFKPNNSTGGHPDFQNPNGEHQGIAGTVCTATNTATCGRLDAEGKPVLVSAGGKVASEASFSSWYRDANAAGWAVETIQDKPLLMAQQGNTDTYVFQDAAFFPINDAANANSCSQDTAGEGCCNAGGACTNRNYHFTSEVRYFFQYRGGETLEFRGDDDVWVFINGRLAVDLGGIHCPQGGRVVLGDEDSSCTDTVKTDCTPLPAFDACVYSATEQGDATDNRFAITKGGVYEIVVFQAERRYKQSNYKLTLSGFLAPRSSCTPVCGDGILTPDEECDDGLAGNTATPEYGKCTAGSCTLGPRCGDKVVNGDEACDNGLNRSVWGDVSATACAPSCQPPPVCGDGNPDSPFEECDLGDALNTALGYDGCTTGCAIGPKCGDGKIQQDAGETCDDGVNDGVYGSCTVECTLGPRCGDMIVQEEWGEQCDGGNNCSENCRLGAQCGDAVVQKELDEECDDGENDGGYGECGPMCTFGPRCGDAVVQEEFEQCDDGENDGGYGECAPNCRIGDRCGDNVLQKAGGETCDDGNLKNNDGCSESCQIESLGPPK